MLPIDCRPKNSNKVIPLKLVHCLLSLIVFNNKGLKGSGGALINYQLKGNAENNLLSADIPHRPNVN